MDTRRTLWRRSQNGDHGTGGVQSRESSAGQVRRDLGMRKGWTTLKVPRDS